MNGKSLIVLCAWIGVLTMSAACDGEPLHGRVFPDAVGWAAYTPGGRGGGVVRVTNLSAEGPGSFVQAVRRRGRGSSSSRSAA